MEEEKHWDWWWPEIDDIDSARETVSWAALIAAFQAVVTLVVIVLVETKVTDDPLRESAKRHTLAHPVAVVTASLGSALPDFFFYKRIPNTFLTNNFLS